MANLGPRRPFSGYAIASVVVALIPIPVPLLGPILAIRYADRAEADIHMRAPYVRGLVLARVGRLLGYLGVVLSIAYFIFIILLFRSRIAIRG